MTRLAWNPSWQSILSNGTVHWPANNYLTGTVYGKLLSKRERLALTVSMTGDYYYIKFANELVENNIVTCDGRWT